MSSKVKEKTKYGEIIKCIIYGIIINILGGLSYWYNLTIRDILKNDFHISFEEEISSIIYDFYNTFVFGQILSGFLWTYILRLMSTRTCILVSLSA